MRKADPVRFHGMTGSVGIVANIRVVEVSHVLLLGCFMDYRVQRSKALNHDCVSEISGKLA
jgi:hypothetical protein